MKKIRKTMAKKLFNAGEIIYLLPSKIKADKEEQLLLPLQKQKIIKTFDTIVIEYKDYVCNVELGKQPSFYIN